VITIVKLFGAVADAATAPTDMVRATIETMATMVRAERARVMRIGGTLLCLGVTEEPVAHGGTPRSNDLGSF
jgi:hypothetical protein